MPRAEYKTIIAPKPTITKIEKYRRERSLPSNSQALVDMVAQVEGNANLIKLLNILLQKIKQIMQDLKSSSIRKNKKSIETLLDLITTIIESITLAKQ